MGSFDEQMYHRQFYRNRIHPFTDIPASAEFSAQNFIDFFGKTWLPANPRSASFDAVVRPFYNQSQQPKSNTFFEIFAVADGSIIPSTSENEAWLDQSIRFVAFIAGNENPVTQASPFDNNGSWTLCVVGSSQVMSETAFMQTASWNGDRFRYYERTAPNPTPTTTPPPAWIYMGDSSMAFGEQSYLGPFNGHVNGSLVMKELHQPWIHWLAGPNNFTNNISNAKLAQFDHIPYLSDPPGTDVDGAGMLSRVQTADKMEIHVKNGIDKWLTSRRKMDFLDATSQPLVQVNNVQRWLSHVLLSTTINISTALPDTNGPYDNILPYEHFYNSDLFGNVFATDIQPKTPSNNFGFKQAAYEAAVDTIGLALVQGYPDCKKDWPSPAHPGIGDIDLGDGTHLSAFVVEPGEGQSLRFNILQPSYEDVQGASKLFSPKKNPILTSSFLFALLMVDPWNPVYSWRRGVLLQYVPESTKLPGPYDPTAKPPQQYDLESAIEAAVRASPRFRKEPDSPEQEFIKNLEASRAGKGDFSNIMTRYLHKIGQRLADPKQADAAMTEYLALAESRRRIYRPVPLDEFDLTLPWATKWPDPDTRYEMTSEGTVVEMAARGRKFFADWITSLASEDPSMIPRPDKDDAIQTTYSPSHPLSFNILADRTVNVLCQPSAARTMRRPRCPALSRTSRITSGRFDEASRTGEAEARSPTWDDDIGSLFSLPYWVEPGERKRIGQAWLHAMQRYGPPIPPSDPAARPLALDSYDQVKLQAITIYQHVASHSMPITKDPNHYWPDSAQQLLLTWINQGCRKKSTDSVVALQPPLTPVKSPVYRTRKDIRDLTSAELSIYRSKLQDVLEVQKLNSRWQKLAEMHAWWCLHYQEATFFWHRCYLRHVEELIDYPVPYWNGFATDVADPGSPHAGIPSAFLEDTYVAPDSLKRDNPLKWAYSFGGKSKSDPTRSYCQRNPILEKGRPAEPGLARDMWDRHITLLTKYHEQIVAAMQLPTFSLPEYDPAEGIHAEAAWAALPAFSDNMDDKEYAVAWSTFDGRFEQAHDNFHGWLGGAQGEMSDNTYTAFDPLFLSYHCNMDRLFDHYLQTNSTRLTANFPLRPFIDRGKAIDFVNPNSWAYTSIGEVARPTAALGYVYAPPACPDIYELPKPVNKVSSASGGTSLRVLKTSPPTAVTAFSKRSVGTKHDLKPMILFDKVACTIQSYIIDIFLNGAKSYVADSNQNPDFIDRLFRFGMGVPPEGVQLKNRDRCQKSCVTRVIDASAVADRIKELGWSQIVTELDGSREGRVMEEGEWKEMKGFEGKLIWL